MSVKRLSVLMSSMAIVGALTCAAGVLAAGSGQDNIASAVADTGRPQADRDLDAARKPAEILTFIGVKPGQKIVDVIPGKDLYFAKLFSVAVGAKGKVYTFLPMEIVTRFKIPLPPVGTAPDPTHPNIIVLAAPINAFATPESVDVVWIRQNYHDLHDTFMGPADVPKFNAAVYKALKPGGEYIVLDHAAPDGSGLADTDTTHRIDAATVKKEVTAAGFVFESESSLLRNPADPRTKLVFDPSIKGHTDQFIFKFRKSR